MGKKCLIVCDSRQEIAIKVVFSISEALESAKWDTDILWMDDEADTCIAPVDLDGYSLVFVGSAIENGLPARGVVELLQQSDQVRPELG